MRYVLLALLRQPSTWRGIVKIVSGLLGLALSESDSASLVSAALVIVGLLGAATLDRGADDVEAEKRRESALPPIDLVGRPEPELISADRVQRHESLGLPTRTDHQAPDRRDPERGGWNG